MWVAQEARTATWDRDKARAALDIATLAETNRDVADYWLSLWTTEGPPTREHFEPRQVLKHLPAVAIFEVMPDGPIFCRLAGTYLYAILGHDLTQHDILEFAPIDERERRRQVAQEIVEGAVSYGLRHFRKLNGTKFTAGEICLPFAGKTEHGGRRYLFHSAWRPEPFSRQYVGVAPPQPSRFGGHRLLSIRMWIVLIVDGETFVRGELCAFLETNGFKALGVSNAKEAREIIERRIPVDLILSDVTLPGETDGAGLAAWVRVHQPELPVILCSGKRPQNIPEGVSFIEKPYDLADVLKRVYVAVARQKT